MQTTNLGSVAIGTNKLKHFKIPLNRNISGSCGFGKAGIPLQRVNSKVIQSDFSEFLSAAVDNEEFTEIAEEDLNNNNTQNTLTSEV